MKKEQQEESTAKKNRKKKKKKKRQNKRVGRKVAVTVSGEAAEMVTGPDVAHRPGPCGGALSIVRRGGPYYYCTDSSTATIGGLHAPIYATFLIHNSDLSRIVSLANNSFSPCLNCLVAVPPAK